MITEIGDRVEFKWEETFGVVLRVEKKPLNMGTVYTVVDWSGDVHTFEDDNLIANFGRSRSQRHHWQEGEQRQYNSLVAQGRTLYDMIRTHTSASHEVAYTLVTEHLPEPFKPEWMITLEGQ